MNFTVLTPNDTPFRDGEGQSATSDSNFGGHREHSQAADAKDYTKRTGKAPDKKENPTDTAVRDVDDMSNSSERKSEFTYQEDKMDVQKGNEAGWRTQSDSDNRPRMDEGSDAVQIPEAYDRKQLKKANKWQFDSSNRYEGEIS